MELPAIRYSFIDDCRPGRDSWGHARNGTCRWIEHCAVGAEAGPAGPTASALPARIRAGAVGAGALPERAQRGDAGRARRRRRVVAAAREVEAPVGEQVAPDLLQAGP